MSLQNLLGTDGAEATLTATINIVGVTQYNQNQKAYQQVTMTDNFGCQAKVKIWQGSGQPLQPTMVGQIAQFKVQSKAYRGRIYLSGFWNSQANVNQSTDSYQDTAQYNAPSVAPPVPVNQPQLSIESKCICRQAIAKSILENYQEMPDIDKQGMANQWVNWCMTGSWENPDIQEDLADSEVPF